MEKFTAVANLLRPADPDRFYTALFAPPARRERLMLLYAFNHELARAWAVASQPMLALIRLQWWREVVKGAEKRHEIATPLRAALAEGAFSAPDLLALIDAWERPEDGFPDTAHWFAFLNAVEGGLAVTAARLLGASAPEDFRRFGMVYGAGRILSRGSSTWLPQDQPDRAALASLVPRPAPRRFKRAEIAAALPAVLGRRDLTRLAAAPRRLGDKLAVLRAYAAARVG